MESSVAYAEAYGATLRLIGVDITAADWRLAQSGNFAESWYEGGARGRAFGTTPFVEAAV